MKFGLTTQNDIPMTMRTSKWKPEVEFQNVGRLFLETGNSNISAADWSTLSKFSVQIDSAFLRYVTKVETGSRFPGLWPPYWKSLRRHNSAADGPICMKFGSDAESHADDDFLFVFNSKCTSTLHRLWDIAFDRPNIALFGYPSCV